MAVEGNSKLKFSNDNHFEVYRSSLTNLAFHFVQTFDFLLFSNFRAIFFPCFSLSNIVVF